MNLAVNAQMLQSQFSSAASRNQEILCVCFQAAGILNGTISVDKIIFIVTQKQILPWCVTMICKLS